MNIDVKAQSAKASFVWNDPFLLEDQLAEDERMIRDAAAAFAADKLAPRVQDAYMEEKTDPGDLPARWGDAGLLGSPSLRSMAAWVPVTSPTAWFRARGRAGRFGLPLDDERAVLPRYAPDPRLWLGRAAQEVPAGAGGRRT